MPLLLIPSRKLLGITTESKSQMEESFRYHAIFLHILNSYVKKHVLCIYVLCTYIFCPSFKVVSKEENEYTIDCQLFLKNVTVEDAGKYKVTARNDLGESNATISLNFDSKSNHLWNQKTNLIQFINIMYVDQLNRYNPFR